VDNPITVAGTADVGEPGRSDCRNSGSSAARGLFPSFLRREFIHESGAAYADYFDE